MSLFDKTGSQIKESLRARLEVLKATTNDAVEKSQITRSAEHAAFDNAQNRAGMHSAAMAIGGVISLFAPVLAQSTAKLDILASVKGLMNANPHLSMETAYSAAAIAHPALERLATSGGGTPGAAAFAVGAGLSVAAVVSMTASYFNVPGNRAAREISQLAAVTADVPVYSRRNKGATLSN